MWLLHDSIIPIIWLQVLTEPKNALGKQYKKMYQMNSVTTPLSSQNLDSWDKSIYLLFLQVKLHFTEKALRLIARKAITKNTGARGLRPLLESILMDSMYEVNFILITYKPMSLLQAPLHYPPKTPFPSDSGREYRQGYDRSGCGGWGSSWRRKGVEAQELRFSVVKEHWFCISLKLNPRILLRYFALHTTAI